MTNIFETDFISSLDTVINRLPNPNIICLYLTNKSIKSYMDNDIITKDIIEDRVEMMKKKNPDRISVMKRKLSAMKLLSLYTFKGCMLCGAKKIRKVYEAFELRLCRECLYSNTLERYYILNTYNIDKDVIHDLPHTSTEIYIKKNRIGHCTVYHYWKETIERMIGKTFKEIEEEKMERLKQMAIQKEIEKKEYYEEWYRIMKDHIRDIISFEDLIGITKFQDLYKNNIQHYDDRLKVRRLYTRIINSHKK